MQNPQLITEIAGEPGERALATIQIPDCKRKVMIESHLSPQTEPPAPVRRLKIEVEGDFWKGGTKPKIRLVGRWLERAGFRPGHRVHVLCVAPGRIELRFADASNDPTH